MSALALNEAECASLLDHRSLGDVLREAQIALATGAATQPLPPAMRAVGDVTEDGAAYLAMSAYAPYLDRYCVKMLADVPRNRQVGRPAQRSTVSLYDADTAECLVIFDGRVPTRMRTAATTAVASEALARDGATVLGLVGAGALAVEHAIAHHALLGIQEVVVWSRTRSSQDRLADELATHGLAVHRVASVAEVFAAADIVCTLTPAEDPIVVAGHLRPGVHVNAVGSPPRPNYVELEPAVLAAASVVTVDYAPLALRESGNIVGAIREGALQPDDLVPLGAVLAGTAQGRRGPDDITIFNSVGIGLQDLVTADLLHRRAVAAGVGTSIDLRSA